MKTLIREETIRLAKEVVAGDVVETLLGAGRAKIEKETRNNTIEARLRMLLGAYENHIKTVVMNSREIGDAEYATQVYGEVVATLVNIRELFDHFPELSGGDSSHH